VTRTARRSASNRGGWSPKLFKELGLKGFEIITYRKGPGPERAPRGVQGVHLHRRTRTQLTTTCSRTGGSRSATTVGVAGFACRQITRLDKATGHQTQILTTRDDGDPAAIAHMMFSRWRQENFFR